MRSSTPRSRQSVAIFANKLCDVIPDVMKAMGYKPNSCILATRVGVEAARRHGFQARPLATRLLAGNGVVLAKANELGRWPNPEEYLDDGGWALGVGFGDERITAGVDNRGVGYDGHLVFVLQGFVIVDLTLSQATRPQYDMQFNPGYFVVGADFLRGHKPASWEVNGGFIQYEALPDDRAFLHTADWRMPPHANAVNPIPNVMKVLAA